MKKKLKTDIVDKKQYVQKLMHNPNMCTTRQRAILREELFEKWHFKQKQAPNIILKH